MTNHENPYFEDEDLKAYVSFEIETKEGFKDSFETLKYSNASVDEFKETILKEIDKIFGKIKKI